ncbi:MAG TPA: hypothetical protein VGN42_10795 [Pirellulales bacterium]|nr:hypothetical protein [Pirellulales bacterium]
MLGIQLKRRQCRAANGGLRVVEGHPQDVRGEPLARQPVFGDHGRRRQAEIRIGTVEVHARDGTSSFHPFQTLSGPLRPGRLFVFAARLPPDLDIAFCPLQQRGEVIGGRESNH